MSFAAEPLRRYDADITPARVFVHVATATLIGVGMGVALYRYPLSWQAVLAGGFGLLGVLALALARYDAAVGLGFLLFGVVAVEPAPPDAVFAVVMALALVTGRFRLDRVPLAVGGLLGAFLFLNVLSAIEAVEPAEAARFFAITFYLAVFAVWFTGYLDSTRRARMVARLYIIGAVLFALLASAALFVPFPGSDLLGAYDNTRAKGLFKDPNVFGPFLVPAALILIEELLRPRLFTWPRTLKIAMLATLGAGLVFSYGRGAWLNFAVGLLTLLVILSLRRGGARDAVAALVVALVVGVAAAGAVAFTGSSDLLQERAQLQRYDTLRFSAQRTGAELGQRYPVGIGPGQFDVVAPVSTHSTYIRTLAEQGVLGLATFAALILTTLLLAARNVALGRDTYGIGSAALAAAWLGLVANSFFVDTLHWRHLWLVAALIWIGAMRPSGGRAATS